MIIALVKGWLRIVLGCMTRKGMERSLGRLEWALGPQGGTASFLSGAYRWKLIDGNRVPVALREYVSAPGKVFPCFGVAPGVGVKDSHSSVWPLEWSVTHKRGIV